MTAEEALQAAESEGHLLQRSNNATGYKGVSFNPTRIERPFCLQFYVSGKQKTLGYFATAEEAALEYARHPEVVAKSEAAAAATLTAVSKNTKATSARVGSARPSMTAAEALELADSEGLTLLRSNNTTGYKGVSFNPTRFSRPYCLQAQISRGQTTLGYFASAEEAALFYARHPEVRAKKEAAAAAALATVAAAPGDIRKRRRLVPSAPACSAEHGYQTRRRNVEDVEDVD